MPRRFHQQVRGTRSVRQNQWLVIDIDEVAIDTNTQLLAASLSAAALLLRPFTVVRTHILVGWRSDQIAASQGCNAAVGLIVVNDQAVVAGVASIPSPVVNQDAPFYVWQPMMQQMIFGSNIGFTQEGYVQYEIDSKAMRKVGPNEDIVVTVENVDNTDGGLFTAIGRFLIKLH